MFKMIFNLNVFEEQFLIWLSLIYILNKFKYNYKAVVNDMTYSKLPKTKSFFKDKFIINSIIKPPHSYLFS